MSNSRLPLLPVRFECFEELIAHFQEINIWTVRRLKDPIACPGGDSLATHRLSDVHEGAASKRL